VTFELSGPGEIVAVGNGDPTSHEPFQASQRRAFNGLCQVIVRSHAGKPGVLKLTATAAHLRPAETLISSQACFTGGGVPNATDSP
jgi:beta-galactosidase